jgi:hypothetical protein
MRGFGKPFTIQVPIPFTVFRQLCDYIESEPRKRELSEVAGTAIEEWLANAVNAPVDSRTLLSGYQWKRLFLPSGTVLRTSFKGRNYQATVDGDCVMFDGRAVSPSEFVNAAGGTARNAWRAVWLLFPDEKTWRIAASCRDALGQSPQRRNLALTSAP